MRSTYRSPLRARALLMFTLACLTFAGVSVAAQAVVPGWAEPVRGALLSVVYEGRVTPQQIASETVALFEEYEHADPVYAADVYRVVYWTSDYDGSPVRVSAGLFIPVSPTPIEAPVLAFGSGTTGIGDQCAPSLENPEVIRLGWYRANMLAYAAQGIIAIFPDYVGFNDTSIPQRYFSKNAEGYLLLDSIRAATTVAESVVTLLRTKTIPAHRSFTAGYSQGGHAALAAADLWKSYAPELELAGAIGFGSTNNVEMLLREVGFYSADILYTYRVIYGEDAVPVDRILQPKWLTDFDFDVLSMCVHDFQLYYPYDIRELYTPRFYNALVNHTLAAEFPAFKKALDENESGLSGHGVSVLLVQGNQDIVVTNAAQEEFAARLRATGVDTTLLEIDNVRHRHTRPAGFDASVSFIRDHTSH